ALLVVAERQGNRVADIAQFARFGLAELDAAGNLAGVDVQTRNDSFCQHECPLKRHPARKASLMTGWQTGRLMVLGTRRENFLDDGCSGTRFAVLGTEWFQKS